MITIRIDGQPVGKQRHRVNLLTGSIYTPNKTVSMEQYIQLLWRQQDTGKPRYQAVKVDFEMVYKRPKRLPKDRDWPSCKPDFDNVIKLVLDSLNKVAYTDDSNVTQGSWVKRYTVGDEEPHVDVTVTFLRSQGPRGRYKKNG